MINTDIIKSSAFFDTQSIVNNRVLCLCRANIVNVVSTNLYHFARTITNVNVSVNSGFIIAHNRKASNALCRPTLVERENCNYNSTMPRRLSRYWSVVWTGALLGCRESTSQYP